MTEPTRPIGGINTSCRRVHGFVGLGALAVALCTAGAVSAQDSKASDAAPIAGLQSDAPQPNEPQLGDIVVTANRRSESINKVAASIAAYDRTTLDQQSVRTFTDIVAQTPGLSFVQPSTFRPANIAIRGVRSVVGAATTGIYIDDTPIQTRNITAQDPGDALPAIFDLDRVEVLRGPQGTLFGSGSEGGAVRFITPTPSLTGTSAYGRSEVATTDSGGITYEGGIAVGTPIVEDKLAARLSASYRHNGGYVDRINERTRALVNADTNSSSVQTVKVAFLYEPTPAMRITPSIYYQETRNHDTGQYYPRLSNPSQERFVSGYTLRQPSTDRFYLPALKVEGDLGGVTATSVTSYFKRRQSGLQDFSALDDGLVRLFTGTLPLPVLLPTAFVAAGGASTAYRNSQDNFTQEVRLQSTNKTSPFNWLVGAFYQKSKQVDNQHTDDLFNAPFFAAVFGTPNVNGVSNYALNFVARDEQIAGFANVEYRFGQIKLAASGRVSSTRFSFVQDLNGPLNGGPHTNVGSQKETPFTPKGSVTWEPSGNALLYATASKGFRAGGANTPVPGSPPCAAGLAALGLTAAPGTYNADSVWNYEIGSKFGAFDRKLQVNASAYHIDWSNIQSFVSLSGCATGFVANLGSAKSDGFDLSVSARPAESLLLLVAGGYNRSRFAETIVRGGVVLAQKDGIVSDSPPWQITTTIEFSQPVGGGAGYLRAIDQYASRNNGLYSRYDTPTASGYDSNGRRDQPFNLVNLRAGWRTQRFDLSIFADNLLNDHPQLNYISNALPTDTTYYANTLRPRTIGLTLTGRY